MVNQFSNIYKTSNHLSPGLTEDKQKPPYDVGNPGSWDSHKNRAVIE
jgi:hypothetical protein